jgi:hypothetical protein
MPIKWKPSESMSMVRIQMFAPQAEGRIKKEKK